MVAANAAAFQERYGFAPSGTYQGKLNNTGERLTLSDVHADTVIASVEFLDVSPGRWPPTAPEIHPGAPRGEPGRRSEPPSPLAHLLREKRLPRER